MSLFTYFEHMWTTGFSSPLATTIIGLLVMFLLAPVILNIAIPLNEQSSYRIHLSHENLYHQMTPANMIQDLMSFVKSVPKSIWQAYVTAFFVPNYRKEWKKYSNWAHNFEPHTGEPSETKKKKVERTVPRALHNHADCHRVVINVSGRLFETQLRSLNTFPDTLLGDSERRMRFWDPKVQQFFFDRHASSFEGIFCYYQNGGTLRRPQNVPMDIFYEECKFFDVSDAAIQKLRLEEGFASPDDTKIMPEDLFKRKVWLLFEYPESSSQARIVTCMSIYVIVLSIFTFCLETVPGFKLKEGEDAEPIEAPNLSDVFFFTETICITWFSCEFSLRLLSCPNKFKFITNIMNMIDLVAIAPYFITVIGSYVDNKAASRSQTISLSFLRVIRLVRVFRIFKLSRYSKGLQILGLTLQASILELGLLMFFLIIGVVIFSSVLYFAEADVQNFKSIPDTFWWGIITMTTVGYGDARPVTELGRVIGMLCAIMGAITIALPVPVIVSNFNYFYHRETETPGELQGVNPYEVSMCPFLPGSYDEEGYKSDASDSSFTQLKKEPYKGAGARKGRQVSGDIKNSLT